MPPPDARDDGAAIRRIRIVPLAGLPLPRLERLARRVFGDGDRPPGWLARKLAREAVDPHLSALALALDEPDPTDTSPAPREHDPTDISLAGPGQPDPTDIPRAGPAADIDLSHVPEDRLAGYLLVGREAGDPLAHSAGVGLVPAARGHGHGAALLAACAEALAGAGLTGLRVLAEPARERWYARRGLRVVARRVTLLAFGTGRSAPVPGAMQPWSTDPAAVELCAWRPGVWRRTAADAAATLDLGAGALAHVSREGAAILVHRLTAPPGGDPRDVVAALLARVDRGAPVLLYGCDAVSSITASLERLGLTAAQRFAEMDLSLGPKLYIPRAPDA